MSSSSEAVVPRGSGEVRPLHHPELSSGTWTRRGPASVRGDQTTELFLDGLAAQTREAARAQGFAVGWAEGMRAGSDRAAREAADLARTTAQEARAREERRDADHAAAVAALVEAAEGLRAATTRICDQVADQATRLAFEVTRAVLERELEAAEDPGEDMVRRVLAALPPEGSIVVRLPPGLTADPALTQLRDRAGIGLVADPDLAAGDAVIETDEQVVDLRVDTALDRLREVLS